MNNDIISSPVTGWEIRQVPPLGIALLTFKFIVSPLQAIESAHDSHNFALQPGALRELARALEAAAASLERSPPSATGLPRH